MRIFTATCSTTLKMNHTISQEVIINRNIDWLFDFTQNFVERKKWDKQTKEIAFLDGFTTLAKGAKVYTESVEGIRMDTEYLTFKVPTEISIKMLNRSSVFKCFVGAWNYIPIEKEKTTLKITYQFDLRFPYNLIKRTVSKKIKANMTNKLNLLEDYLEKMEK